MCLENLSLFLKKSHNELFSSAHSMEINGLVEEGRDFILPLIIASCREEKRPVVLICEDEKIAKSKELFYQNLGFKAQYFPQKIYSPYGVLSQSLELEFQRQGILRGLRNNSIELLLITVGALQKNLPPIEAYEALSIFLEINQVYDLEKLKLHLVEIGYQAVKVVENVGEFSFRGEIFDIYPVGYEFPVRIEFFDTEIERITFFDETTQLRLADQKQSSSVEIGSIYSLKNTNENQLFLKQQLISVLDSERRDNKNIDYTYFERYLLEEDAFLSQFEQLLPLFYSTLSNILEYFQVFPLLILNNLSQLERVLIQQLEINSVQIATLKKEGQFLPFQEQLFFNEAYLKSLFKREKLMAFSYLPKKSRFIDSVKRHFLSAENIQSYHKDLEQLKDDLVLWRDQNKTVILGYSDNDEKEKWKNFLAENQFFAQEVLKENELCILNYPLNEGLVFSDIDLVYLPYSSIFAKNKVRQVRKKQKEDRQLLSLEDLEIGDYIVHEAHGIGIYGGIEHIQLKDSENDYLILKYKGNDRLLIPIHQIKQLQKYHGEEGKVPRITDLNSKEWAKTKAKVQGAIEDIAKALLKVSAERKMKEGFAFTYYQEEEDSFKAAFPYLETPDQALAIKETLKDMTMPYPMDRLICGDVGYGKTEVAMRAAYRAVLNHKQVVVLVPTTVLCEQHFRTFKERFSDFGVEIYFFNRFTGKKDEKEILEKLKNHQIDILIGTHKLLSEKIEYSDLGLLVVDEEQRFGVKHKEKIKALKTSVDILTLTATPIPRTLHMSMVGLRDVSLIETPPQNRQPIKTYIIEHQMTVIAQAIQRELSRGGQVFYVRNHVDSLDDIADELKYHFPHATIGLAHGKMKEAEIDGTILSFINKEIDILVCTTIIETGIDIANANTLIVEHADNFGLSQLYQLRGRVGRSAQVAYAYLTYAKNKVLSDISEKRLMALKQYTALGSGHKIALRDLKIRGSGNILGKEQSGQMLSVGFELYMYMLEETIALLKGEKKDSSEVELQLKLNAFISEKYIQDLSLRLSLYKRIYAIKEIDVLAKLYFETLDRFGDMPKETARLFSLMKVKLLAQQCFIKKILGLKEGYEIYFYEEKLENKGLILLVKALQDGVIKGYFAKKDSQDILVISKEKEGLDYLSHQLKTISSIVNQV